MQFLLIGMIGLFVLLLAFGLAGAALNKDVPVFGTLSLLGMIGLALVFLVTSILSSIDVARKARERRRSAPKPLGSPPTRTRTFLVIAYGGFLLLLATGLVGGFLANGGVLFSVIFWVGLAGWVAVGLTFLISNLVKYLTVGTARD